MPFGIWSEQKECRGSMRFGHAAKNIHTKNADSLLPVLVGADEKDIEIRCEKHP